MQLIPISEIADSPLQALARSGGLDWDHIVGLARSIQANADPGDEQRGLLQPVRLRLVDGAYQTRNHHRVAAFVLLRDGDGGQLLDESGEPEFPGDARFSRIPAYVDEADDEALVREAVAEVFHTMEHNYIEQARILRRALNDGMTRAEVCAQAGLRESALSNKLRLLDLPDELLKEGARGELTERHLRALLWLNKHLHDTLQQYLAEDGRGLWRAPFPDQSGECPVSSVADTEEMVGRVMYGKTGALSLWAADWEPFDDDRLEAAELEEYENLLGGECSECEWNVAFRREPRCINRPCYNARLAITYHLADQAHNARIAEARAEMLAPDLAPSEADDGDEPREFVGPTPRLNEEYAEQWAANVRYEEALRAYRDEVAGAILDVRRHYRNTAEIDLGQVAGATPLLQMILDMIARPHNSSDAHAEVKCHAALWKEIVDAALKRAVPYYDGATASRATYERVVAAVNTLGGQVDGDAERRVAEAADLLAEAEQAKNIISQEKSDD